MTAVLTAVAKRGPKELAGRLLRDVGGLGNIGLEIPAGIIDPKRGAESAAKLSEGAADAIGGVGTNAKEVVKGLGGLFQRSDEE